MIFNTVVSEYRV